MSNLNDKIRSVECPRDAMQGLHDFISTENKIRYLNKLLRVGFDVLDFGSFVSPKAIPQLADTKEVLAGLDLEGVSTELLAIVANTRGAEEASAFSAIKYLGFPLSVSETFQMRNTNKSIAQALEQVAEIHQLCAANNKEAVIYISMGFGNPYGDDYSADAVLDLASRLYDIGVRTISLADTVGVAAPDNITYLFSKLIPAFPDLRVGAHFHSAPNKAIEKLQSAYDAGCRMFDSTIKGLGGCPMAKDDLVGNIATETVLAWSKNLAQPLSIDERAFADAMVLAAEIFPA